MAFFNNVILVIFSIITIFLSIVGEYVLRIYLHLKKLKTIIYDKTVNINYDEKSHK